MQHSAFPKDYKKYCQSDKFQHCIKNIHNLQSIIEPFNIYRTVLQALWIRDIIGITNIIKTIFINQFGFKINVMEIEINSSESVDSTIDDMLKKIKTNGTSRGDIYIIFVYIPSHVNLIYMDSNPVKEKNGSVYIYEPHVPDVSVLKEYEIYTQLQKTFAINNYIVLQLPNNILIQRNLPLCYMYAFHFFIYIFATRNESERLIIYKWDIDNLYIMNFTRFILKLCHEYTLIGDIDYYILTNNTFQIQKLVNKDTRIDDLLSKISSNTMIRTLYDLTDRIRLGIESIIVLISKAKENMDDIYNVIENIIKIPNKTAHQIIDTRITVDIIQTLLPEYRGDKLFKSFISKTNCTKSHESDLPDSGSNELKRDALMYVVEKGNMPLTKLLLSKNLDPNTRNRAGSTALIIAVYNGHIDIVKLLLDRNVEINLQDNVSWTALMFAVSMGYTDIVKLLLDHNAETNIQNNVGWTALMDAVGKGYTDIVKLLLDHNAETNIQNNVGWTALMLAANSGYTDIVKLLLDHNAEIDLQSNNGWTALMFAADEGHIDIVKLLLDRNAQVDLQINNGWTVLMIATNKDYVNIIKLLLSKNANVDSQNTDGQTALTLAKNNKNNEIYHLLLNKSLVVY